MPITPTYPGVYIQELASDVRTIVPVDTATAAFIGRALRGPVNEPVTIFGFEEFESQFGGLWLESKLGYAVRDFFLNGGSKALIVRVFNPSATGNGRATLSQFSAHPPLQGSVDLYHSLQERRTVAALKTAAADALTLAQQAKADADAAKTAADAAKTAADSAKTAADAAKAAADTALTTAKKAVDDAGASATQQQKGALDQAKATADTKTAAALQAKANLDNATARAAAATDLAAKIGAVLEAAAGQNATAATAMTAAKNAATAKADAPTAKAAADTAKAAADTALATAQQAVDDAGANATQAQKDALDQAKAAADTKTTAALQAKANLDNATAAADLAGRIAVAQAVQEAAAKQNATVANVFTSAQKAISEVATSQNAALGLQARSPGAWGNRLAARITAVDDDISDQLASQYGVLPQELFNIVVRDTRTGDEEAYQNVTFGPGQRQLHKVLNDQSSLVEAVGAPPTAPMLFKPHDDVTEKLNWWDDQNASSIVPTANAANDGDPLTDAVVLGESEAETDGETIVRGINALDHADIFNMLCIPPYDSSDTVSPDVLAEAAAYCEKRRAMLIVDPPADWTSWSKAQKGFPIPGLSPSPNAAIFFPRLRKRNPLRDNQLEDSVPCGAVAGVMARTDFRRGVWKAAAGLEATLNGVEGFSVAIDDNANGQLNPKGINCLRVMPAAGPVVWGARTTVGDDRLANQWKYIPVRRMALWIEETLYRNTQWAVFEPNDEPLWSSLRLNIGNFMNDLFRQGAFQGKAPADAYFVRCDAITTTQNDIDRGIVNIIVGFAPLKPAEFVVISIKQITNQGAAA